ncbi:P-loop containing nucleoside triphosphate hydrolase [Pseudocohnilembus persalinus]|uniref:p-loop containing nucleoside triphosphate hydrolase n=1 Tax=Pseudocohnilembus persalinus TaxID=266149 RepID=A0A0V0QS60_PSEPJ|nr:P-loop containing nucleoside triphosphate hydrolase [Pseudocohnilembus persalinus]|eukprot:KRX05084.1 P-loop containing nucleoside triphosphate hydrolase [Pseudocohnilembus persalinus]
MLQIPKEEEQKIVEKKANLVLLTGYLGSGKTTLVQYILKEQKQYKVAIIQNEFADEMGIEAPLMQDSEGKPFDKFYELPNGCICCTVKDDLLTAVEYLITSENYKLDFVLVETNGLADPSQVIQNFWVDENSGVPAELKSIHTVVPVHRFQELKQKDIFIRQLIFADTILVNQIDREDEEKIQQVEKELKILNPLAKLKRSSYCQIDLNDIFEIDGFTMKQQKFDFVNKLENFSLSDHAHQDEKVQCQFLQFDKEFDAKDIEIKLGTLIWECEDKYVIHRIKGILNVKGEDNIYAVQGVEDIFEVKKSNVMWKEGEKRQNKILFITENIKKEEIEKIILD